MVQAFGNPIEENVIHLMAYVRLFYFENLIRKQILSNGIAKTKQMTKRFHAIHMKYLKMFISKFSGISICLQQMSQKKSISIERNYSQNRNCAAFVVISMFFIFIFL